MRPVFADLLAGRVGLLIAALPTAPGALREGRARAIAIGTTGNRIPALRRVMEGEPARWSKAIRVKGITLRN